MKKVSYLLQDIRRQSFETVPKHSIFHNQPLACDLPCVCVCARSRVRLPYTAKCIGDVVENITKIPETARFRCCPAVDHPLIAACLGSSEEAPARVSVVG